MPESGLADTHLAFRYASGEMATAEAAEFERRLGEEQKLRESLCQAVELLQSLEEIDPSLPRPEYRQRVRQQLRLRRREQRRTRPRRYRGHPMFWSGLGAAAALLAVLLLSSVAKFDWLLEQEK